MPQPSTSDTGNAVADMYAEALLPLARQSGNPAGVLEELEQVQALLESEADFRLLVASAVLSVPQRLACLERAFRGRLSDLVCDALMVMARHGRMGLLPAMAGGFRKALLRQQGYILVQVTSATPLEEPVLGEVTLRLAELLGGKPMIQRLVDERLLGGLVVRIGDKVIDASLSGQLKRMRSTLAQRGQQRPEA